MSRARLRWRTMSVSYSAYKTMVSPFMSHAQWVAFRQASTSVQRQGGDSKCFMKKLIAATPNKERSCSLSKTRLVNICRCSLLQSPNEQHSIHATRHNHRPWRTYCKGCNCTLMCVRNVVERSADMAWTHLPEAYPSTGCTANNVDTIAFHASMQPVR